MSGTLRHIDPGTDEIRPMLFRPQGPESTVSHQKVEQTTETIAAKMGDGQSLHAPISAIRTEKRIPSECPVNRDANGRFFSTPSVRDQDDTDETTVILRQRTASLIDKALDGLTKRIRGFSVKETKTVFEQDVQGNRKVKSETVTVKRIPPDFAAIVFTLTNLDREHWQAKPLSRTPEEPSDVEPDMDEADLSALSEQALREIAGISPATTSSACPATVPNDSLRKDRG